MNQTSPLENLAGPGKPLHKEPPDQSETNGLQHTLGLGPEVWRVLAKCHEVRNLGEYEGDLNINERLVTDLIMAVKRVADALSNA
jgi:hypothetical protein